MSYNVLYNYVKPDIVPSAIHSLQWYSITILYNSGSSTFNGYIAVETSQQVIVAMYDTADTTTNILLSAVSYYAINDKTYTNFNTTTGTITDSFFCYILSYSQYLLRINSNTMYYITVQSSGGCDPGGGSGPSGPTIHNQSIQTSLTPLGSSNPAGIQYSPFQTVNLYSISYTSFTQIKSSGSTDTSLSFNGFFVTDGLFVKHFYNDNDLNTDVFVNNGKNGADAFFSEQSVHQQDELIPSGSPTPSFSYGGTNISTFPDMATYYGYTETANTFYNFLGNSNVYTNSLTTSNFYTNQISISKIKSFVNLQDISFVPYNDETGLCAVWTACTDTTATYLATIYPDGITMASSGTSVVFSSLNSDSLYWVSVSAVFYYTYNSTTYSSLSPAVYSSMTARPRDQFNEYNRLYLKNRYIPNPVLYKKLVTGGNNPALSKALRYSQYIRSGLFAQSNPNK